MPSCSPAHRHDSALPSSRQDAALQQRQRLLDPLLSVTSDGHVKHLVGHDRSPTRCVPSRSPTIRVEILVGAASCHGRCSASLSATCFARRIVGPPNRVRAATVTRGSRHECASQDQIRSSRLSRYQIVSANTCSSGPRPTIRTLPSTCCRSGKASNLSPVGSNWPSARRPTTTRRR
jgi:hypothetical protein